MSSLINKFDPIEKMVFEDGLRIKALHFHKDLGIMVVVLNNGKILKQELSCSSILPEANEDQLNDFRLIGKGVGIHWPQLDEDISLKGLLQEAFNKVGTI